MRRYGCIRQYGNIAEYYIRQMIAGDLKVIGSHQYSIAVYHRWTDLMPLVGISSSPDSRADPSGCTEHFRTRDPL